LGNVEEWMHSVWHCAEHCVGVCEKVGQQASYSVLVKEDQCALP